MKAFWCLCHLSCNPRINFKFCTYECLYDEHISRELYLHNSWIKCDKEVINSHELLGNCQVKVCDCYVQQKSLLAEPKHKNLKNPYKQFSRWVRL